MEEEKKVSTVQNGPNEKTNLLKKSKYTFFIILSYCCSRTEGRMLLHKISKRG
jgi:hypothetical protein